MTFSEFVKSAGIIPPEEFTPGRWQRCGTETHPRSKNANVKLCDDKATGFAIDFASMSEAAVWRSGDSARVERTALDNAALSATIALRRQEETKGTMRAQTLYANAEDLRFANHEYCRRKQITMSGMRGVKVDAEGWLVVPVYRAGKLISVQRINEPGEKRFAPGAPTKAGSFRLWRPGAPILILAEGLATACSVFEACPMAMVEVCFSASNMVAVAERIEWPGMMAVAGDNDQYTVCQRHKAEGHCETFDPESPRPEWCQCNPGKTYAMKAAAILGVGYAVPYCEETDFNDLFRERLAKLEKPNAEKSYPDGPHKLRQTALLPIRTALMACAASENKSHIMRK